MSRRPDRAATSPIDRLVIINDRSAAVGGASALALLNAELAARAGIPVTFVCGDQGPAGGESVSGIDYVAAKGNPISPDDPKAGFVRGLWNTASRHLLQQWIQRHDTPRTIYHVHGWSKILSPSVFAALRTVSDRLVMHAHDFFLACPNGAFVDYSTLRPCPLRGGSPACLLAPCDQRSTAHKTWRFLRHQLRIAAMPPAGYSVPVLMIHEKMREYFRRDAGWSDDQLTTVPNPVTPFSATRVTAEGNRAFFFIGRLVEEKGAAVFLSAASAAGVAAKVIGDGPQLAELRAAYPQAEFLGWRSKAQIGELISQARALVVPTRYPETFGLVAIEAMGSGVPVLISDQAFIAREIVDLGGGHSFDVRDAEALASTLRSFGQDDERVHRASLRAHANWRKCCTSPDEWFSRLHDLYRARLGVPVAAS